MTRQKKIWVEKELLLVALIAFAIVLTESNEKSGTTSSYSTLGLEVSLKTWRVPKSEWKACLLSVKIGLIKKRKEKNRKQNIHFPNLTSCT